MAQTAYPKLEDLQAWKRAMDFAVLICRDTLPLLPKDEKFALTDQLRRAVQSVPANIAEGFGRHHFQEAVRYCYIARGSLVEVHSHLTFALRMDYLPKETCDTLTIELREVHRTLNGYITYLKRIKQGAE